MYLQCWHGWCHKNLLPSRRFLCTPYNHALCHFMQSHIRKVYACLAVICHLHFWQNDRGLLRATAVTQGWNGYRNKSQHRKLTLDKKILLPLQQGFEPATFRSRSGALTTELSLLPKADPSIFLFQHTIPLLSCCAPTQDNRERNNCRKASVEIYILSLQLLTKKSQYNFITFTINLFFSAHLDKSCSWCHAWAGRAPVRWSCRDYPAFSPAGSPPAVDLSPGSWRTHPHHSPPETTRQITATCSMGDPVGRPMRFCHRGQADQMGRSMIWHGDWTDLVGRSVFCYKSQINLVGSQWSCHKGWSDLVEVTDLNHKGQSDLVGRLMICHNRVICHKGHSNLVGKTKICNKRQSDLVAMSKICHKCRRDLEATANNPS